MKLLIIIALAVFGLANGKSISTQSLVDDFQDFMELLPTDEIIAIALDYYQNDAETQAAVEYLQSDEFKKIVLEMESLKELQDFFDYLQGRGLDVYSLLNTIHELLGLPPYKPSEFNHKSTRRGTGLNGLIDDVIAILPREELKALFQKKLETSPDFLNLVNTLKSPEFQKIVNKLVSMPEYQNLKQRLRDRGVDIDKYVEMLRALFGWSRGNSMHTQGLQEDFQDFLKLVPTDKILAIFMDYLANDKEVQDAVEYVQSEDFKKIVVTIDGLPEYIEFLNYLQNSGLDVYYYVNLLHDLLDLPNLPPPIARHVLYRTGKRGSGIRGLLDDILAVLPIQDLKALFEEKLKTSPDFKALIERLKSPEFRRIVEKLQSMPEYQDIKQKLEERGIDVQRIIEIVKALIGWTD